MSAVIAGLVQGGAYALFALSLALLFSVMRLVNFAHGDLLTLALYGIVATEALQLPLPLAVLGVSLGMAALGLLAYVALFSTSLRARQPALAQVFSTIGLSIIIQNSLATGFGSNTRSVATPVNGTLQLWSTSVSFDRLVPVIVLVILLAAISLLFRYTRFGVQVRAVAADRQSALLSGINVSRVYLFVCALAFALIGIAAGALAPVLIIYPTVGFNLLLIGLMAVVIGGLGSITGAVLGGLLLGMIESVAAYYIGPLWAPGIIYLFFLGILLLRPRGLLGDPAWKVA